MITWKPTKTIPSTTAEGVIYHFKRFSAGRRADLELALTEYRAEVAKRGLEYAQTIEDVPKVSRKITVKAEDQDGAEVVREEMVYDETSAEWRRNRMRTTLYTEQIQSIQRRYEVAATLRTYLTRIEGIADEDGKEKTVESLIADGPEELTDEAFNLIDQHGKMTDAERKNSQSPTTSLEAEDGAKTSTTVASAGNAENGQLAAA